MNHTDLVKGIIEAIGDDVTRDGLKDTPARVAKSWGELYSGYRMNPATFLQTQFSLDDYDQMIILRDVEFFSMCEHHMLPFFGKAHVGYVPQGGKVVGLSKLARVVDAFARRLQIQERLTHDIATTIQQATDALGVAVIIEAKHTCMMARGIQKQDGVMTTSAMLGVFRAKDSARNEFLALVKK